MGWIVICVTLPFVGPLGYFLFGINRIETRARTLQDGNARASEEAAAGMPATGSPAAGMPAAGAFVVTSSDVASEYSEVAHISEAVTGRPLVAGNRIRPLHNGEQAYPAMLEAIAGAERSLYLATYIFETNRTGREFVDALARAAGRGVDVRVLVGGIGEKYSRPRHGEVLRKREVRFARFLPPRILPPALHLNLRNHRKILVADNRVAFTGGMNIGDRHLAAASDNPTRVVDLHFRLEGPIASQLAEVFLEDWLFATGEDGPPPDAPRHTAGDAICRAAIDGPDEDLGKLFNILVGRCRRRAARSPS